MNNVVRHIEYLLTRHDCVVVPGWGAWIVQSVSAVVAGNAAPIPPRKWLSFNAALSHNDGTLAHSLMRAEGCSYDEAMAQIAAEVSSWRTALQAGQSVEVGHIGSFSCEDGASLLFKESAHSVVNATLAMLPHITLSPLSEMPQEDTDVVVSGWRQVQEPSSVRRFFGVVASVAALVAVLLFISTPIDDNYPTQNDYASIVAAELFAPSLPAEAETSEAEPAMVSEKESFPVSVAATTEVQSDEAEHEAVVDVVPRYILVVGSLPTYALAEKQVEQFRASGVTAPLHIYDNGGKARLYIAGYDTMAEAQQHLTAVQHDAASPFEGIWICRTR